MRFRKVRIAWSVGWLLSFVFFLPLFIPLVSSGDFSHPDFAVQRKATIAIVAIIAVAWVPDRFSLRTLLIATTLVAAVLGLAVYMAGK